MSIEAINWAKKQRVSPTQKLVLLVLADCADSDGLAFPSMSYLEEVTGLSDKAIRNAKRAMMSAGFLVKEDWMRLNDIRLAMTDISEKTEPRSVKPVRRSRNTEPRSVSQKTEPRSATAEPASIETEPRSAVPEPPRTTKNHHTIPPTPQPKKSTASKPKAATPKVVLPDWMPIEAWDGFVEMRRKSKKPFTDRAAQLIVKKLASLRDQGDDPGEVLDRSTVNGWQGVFPMKNQANVVPFQPHQQRNTRPPRDPFAGFADGFTDVEIPELSPEDKALMRRYRS